MRLFWEIKEDRKHWRESREGAYLLRTNLKAETAEELWSKYMQLTEAEASFRALKSELSVRPLFHQLEPRVKAHVMVAFLGYAFRGHAWAQSAWAATIDGPKAIGERSGKSAADDADACARAAFHAAKRRHRSCHYRWTQRSACVALPNQRRSRKHSFINWASVCPNIFSSTANVVQTRRSPEPIFNGLAQFWPVW